MRIFNESKTKQIFDYDLSKGRLVEDKLFIMSHPKQNYVPEVGHYQTEKIYKNGGKEVKWVVDIPSVPAKPAWDEYEDILVFVQYTQKELLEREVAELKQKLSDTDYKAIKFSEGIMTEQEYYPIRELRQSWRQKINELEQQIIY